MPVIEQILLDIVVSAFPEVESPNISLDVPPKKELGDFAFNIFPYAKITKLAPPAIAERVAEALRAKTEYFRDVSIMGGYVNFFLTNASWADLFGSLSIGNKPARNETVVVDYIGSNIGKPLHIGHMCTPVIGQSIINTHRYLGYKVIGDNHLGDWGGIFGKLITLFKLGAYIKNQENSEWLNQEEIERYDVLHKIFKQDFPASEEETVTQATKRWNEGNYGDDFLSRLADSYIVTTYIGEHSEVFEEQYRVEFKKLSRGDVKNAEIWEMMTSVSVDKLEKLLDRLNIKSDYAIGESFYEGLPLPKIGNHPNLIYDMRSVVQEIVNRGIAMKNEDGSIGVTFPEDTKIPSCMLAKRDGTHGYLASDLATIKYRMTNGWNPSKILYCIDNRQQLHLKQCFWIAQQAWPELLGNVELAHVSNGAIRLKEGAMSSRK